MAAPRLQTPDGHGPDVSISQHERQKKSIWSLGFVIGCKMRGQRSSHTKMRSSGFDLPPNGEPRSHMSCVTQRQTMCHGKPDIFMPRGDVLVEPNRAGLARFLFDATACPDRHDLLQVYSLMYAVLLLFLFTTGLNTTLVMLPLENWNCARRDAAHPNSMPVHCESRVLLAAWFTLREHPYLFDGHCVDKKDADL